MYDFPYNSNNSNKTKYGDNAKLLLTDTDTLAYEIKTKDFYKDMNADIEKRFDISDYPTNQPSAIKTGLISKVLGMFKDEASGKHIVEFVGFRAKLYSYKMLRVEYKKCKMVSKDMTKMNIEFNDYRGFSFTWKEQHWKMNVIRSHCHENYIEEINKIALSSEDDQRVIMADGIHTLSCGHRNMKNCN